MIIMIIKIINQNQNNNNNNNKDFILQVTLFIRPSNAFRKNGSFVK